MCTLHHILPLLRCSFCGKDVEWLWNVKHLTTWPTWGPTLSPLEPCLLKPIISGLGVPLHYADNLLHHIMNNHFKLEYVCKTCERSYLYPFALKRHKAMKHLNWPIVGGVMLHWGKCMCVRSAGVGFLNLWIWRRINTIPLAIAVWCIVEFLSLEELHMKKLVILWTSCSFICII